MTVIMFYRQCKLTTHILQFIDMLAIPLQAFRAPVGRGSVFLENRHMKEAKLSAEAPAVFTTPGDTTGWVDPRSVVWLDGFS